jgi:hypothetical protein
VVDAIGVFVRRFHAVDFLEGKRLHALFGGGFITTVDIVGNQFPPLQRWYIVPFDALAQLEGLCLKISTTLPGFRRVGLERQIRVILSFVGECMAQQAVVGERGNLEGNRSHGRNENYLPAETHVAEHHGP